MALNIADRLRTIVVTAALTSLAWVVVGSSSIKNTGDAAAQSGERSDAPNPAPSARAVSAAQEGEAGELIVPVAGVVAAELTDTFSDARGGGARLHEALDIMADAGTPVLAAAPGTVERLFHSDAGGNTIYLRSQDRRTIHYYAHLRDYAPGLAAGQSVRRGQRLGSVGSSGNADPSAPHLHFAILRTAPDAEWWEPATAVNPYPLLQRAGRGDAESRK